MGLPSLLLRGPNVFKFERLNLEVDTAPPSSASLGIPKDSRTEIQIVDGQHRTLGFHLAWEQLNDEIQKARALLASAKENQDAALMREFETKLNTLIERRDTLAAERVSVQILVVEQPTEARRIFVDIKTTPRASPVQSRRASTTQGHLRALNRVLENNTFLDSKSTCRWIASPATLSTSSAPST